MEWKKMPAPNYEDILVARDDGSVELIESDDNDFNWQPYTPSTVGAMPTHWMLVPAAPVIVD